MLLRVVKTARSLSPFLIEVVDILTVTGGCIHPRPHRRRHEERIAPPPGNLLARNRRGPRRGQDRIQLFLSRLQHRRVFLEQIELQISLSNALIVGVGKMGAKLPVVLLAHGKHGIAVLGIAEGLRSGHESAVENAPGPYPVQVGLRPFQLPVGNLAHGLGHNCLPGRGGKVRSNQAGVIRGVAKVPHFVVGNVGLFPRRGLMLSNRQLQLPKHANARPNGEQKYLPSNRHAIFLNNRF